MFAEANVETISLRLVQFLPFCVSVFYIGRQTRMKDFIPKNNLIRIVFGFVLNIWLFIVDLMS